MKTVHVAWLLGLAIPAWAGPVNGEFLLTRQDGDNWLAQYCFQQAVTAFRFERPIEGMRESHWQAADPEFGLVYRDNTAKLQRVDGAPFECGAVRVLSYTELPEKNYYAVSRFSDGGASVYTGYYMGPALVDGEWRETALAARYAGREGEQVITRKPESLVEQFVYFGRQAVESTPAVIAVIDPAMPAVARQRILDTVPAVNELLADVFNFHPASPYMIFMATEHDAFDGHSIKGGALDGQIEFNLKGRGLAALIERNPDYFAKTTAHEVIHLWQREYWFSMLGNDQPWVHEGSADALAYEILRRTGAYNDNDYANAWQTAESACVEQLKTTSVHSGPGNGNFDVVYQCGALVNRLAGEMLEPEDPGRGLVRLWRQMAAWPADARKGESETLFFRSLAKLGIDGARIDALRAFLDLQSADAESWITRLRARLAKPGA